ncbi:hypothetical protein CAP36_13235 [Chitinophagaceae bacterium IBVUCB2]|nr:hypothetical protein CAP36_13235 [Chitinophagaceae bacterium IBVUCB2]
MVRLIHLFFLLLLCGTAHSQQQTYDIFTFNAPKKWNKAAKENNLIFSITDNSNRTWAQIDLLKSTASKGSIYADFQNEWKDLVMTRYGVSGEPLTIDSNTYMGWKLYTGLGKFLVKTDTAFVLLNTFSDGYRCASFVLLSNTTAYGTVLEEFAGSVKLSQPKTSTTQPKPSVNSKTTATNDGFQFNTTNFDDGWTSVVKEEWVEATKGNIKVLLHYPRAEDSKYYTQHDERMNVFWNLLVAPRYSNLRNYEAPGSNLPESAYFACGLLKDNASGKDVWVTLFNKGKSGWIEIITPDKNTFVQIFGINNPHMYYTEWNSLLNLAGMNRFAVGEKDLTGKWSNEFQGSTAYYNTYTGVYAGSTTHASRQNFIFRTNKTYNWDLVVGSSSYGSTMKVDQAKASGNWKMLGNWQVWFSEIERQPKTYNAYFSCFKGGRILWLQDVSYGSYTAYGKISN